ncbi:hypothetical protein BCR39DRAFT_552966 [Naematelia encephala]|uniref:FHA domain-containing protein n=1 Tax=Naematelia encephala TaxID=71784 RepID=A0A1Y2AII3_9TREE|nr:hypothetical protein BCR39DRAFT_552966 [Naematelia encephala]
MAQSNAYTNGHSAPWGSPFPSLHLWPIQETFQMKMIHLPEGQRIKIGRQTNTKTAPGERNAYFDSKVLSRTHAEIWEQNGQIYIRDIKSSNGTFVNNERLSPEGVESEPFQLKSEDLVEFGIDIVSDDNRTIVHHKVAAKVYCVFNAEDASLSAREMAGQKPATQERWRPMNPAMPAMAPVMSSGGKANGVSFDHVLYKLQSELAKSKATEQELQTLATTMTDIQDTLGGGLAPSQNGSAVAFIPPQYRSAEAQAALTGPHGQQAAAFISLQNQLAETQSSLTTHLDKIRHLELQIQEHELLKHDVASLRDEIYESQSRGRQLSRDDDDDAKSVATLMDSEDAEERVRERRRVERPATPDSELVRENAELLTRVQALTNEIGEAVQLSRTLQAQHTEAMSTVRHLSERVGDLENGIAKRVAHEVETRLEAWRSKLEDGWRRERESWDAERERLRSVVREWEEASRRAHEEEEERELNESLSDDVGEAAPVRRTKRRRRPSHKAQLAARALHSVAEPTVAAPVAEKAVKSTALRVPPFGAEGAGERLGKEADKDSSESDKDSGDTLQEDEVKNRKKPPRRNIQPIPVFTVVFVAAVAGALYYRHKD